MNIKLNTLFTNLDFPHERIHQWVFFNHNGSYYKVKRYPQGYTYCYFAIFKIVEKKFWIFTWNIEDELLDSYRPINMRGVFGHRWKKRSTLEDLQEVFEELKRKLNI